MDKPAAAQLDARTHRKLYTAKGLFENAVTQSARHTPTGRLLSVIGFDLALETVLRAACTALDSSKNAERTLPQVCEQLELLLQKAGRPGLLDKAHILHIHEVRNGAQHKAVDPSPSVVEDCRTYARDALSNLIREVWQAAFTTLSRTDLVRDKKCGNLLRTAETRFAAGDWRTAIQESGAALTWALDEVSQAVVGGLMDTYGPPPHPFQTGAIDDGGLHAAYRKSISRLQLAVLLSTLGLDLATHLRINDLIGTIGFSRADVYFCQGGKQYPTEEEAELVLTYGTDVVLRVEEYAQSIEEPFGSKYW